MAVRPRFNFIRIKTMSTENETWRDASSAEENSGAGRDGNQFNKEGGYSVRLTTVIMATVLIAPDLTVKTGTARSVLITVTALIARALILVRTMVTVRSVLVTITIMATVPIVRAITAKAATVRNALMETIRVDRPYRPRYNSEGGDRPQRPYNSDRPQRPAL